MVVSLSALLTGRITNLEEEEIVDAPGNHGNASMPEQIKRPNPWRKTTMMMMMILGSLERACEFKFHQHQVFVFFPLRRFQSIYATTFCNSVVA
jgi:hypothetical protein